MIKKIMIKTIYSLLVIFVFSIFIFSSISYAESIYVNDVVFEGNRRIATDSIRKQLKILKTLQNHKYFSK